MKRTRPFRPQTNGKAEAFNKIMKWASNARTTPTASGSRPGFLAYYTWELRDVLPSRQRQPIASGCAPHAG